MKLLTLLFFISLFYHAWIGVRDIFMDYIKPLSIRLTLQALTVLYLVACAAYAVEILWKV
jgi:succinate dehydrogenase / fumarate reductase membrane anchor subunit